MRIPARSSAIFILYATWCLEKSVFAGQASLNAFQDNGAAREAEAVLKYDLTRLRDQQHLKQFIDAGLLARVPDNGLGFYTDRGIGGHADLNRVYYRYARPYALRFIRRLGKQFHEKFRRSFVVTSLVRTCKYQERLQSGNPNAIPCDRTSHITGATVDISYSFMNSAQRTWIEGVLLRLEERGFIQATKERIQPVYHVMVYPQYLYWGTD